MTREQKNIVFGGILSILIMQAVCTMAILSGIERERTATRAEYMATADALERTRRQAEASADDVLEMQSK